MVTAELIQGEGAGGLERSTKDSTGIAT